MKELSRLVGISDQQASILEIIIRLEKDSTEPSLKAISMGYANVYGKHIQLPNLFAQLKLLCDKDILTKTGSRYDINIVGIKEVIEKRKREVSALLEDFDDALGNLESFMKSKSPATSPPPVKYYSDIKLFEQCSAMFQTATQFYCTSTFPALFRSYAVNKALGREPYEKALEDRMITRAISIHYLAAFDLNYLARYALAVYQKPELAYKECRGTIDRAEMWIQRYKNLKIRFSKHPWFLGNIMLLESPYEKNLIFFLRGKLKEMVGGLTIEAVDVYNECKKVFLNDFRRARVVDERFLAVLREDLARNWKAIVVAEKPNAGYVRKFLLVKPSVVQA